MIFGQWYKNENAPLPVRFSLSFSQQKTEVCTIVPSMDLVYCLVDKRHIAPFNQPEEMSKHTATPYRTIFKKSKSVLFLDVLAADYIQLFHP